MLAGRLSAGFKEQGRAVVTVQTPASAQGTAADSPGTEHIPAAGRCAGVVSAVILGHACITEHLFPTLGSASCCANIMPSPPSERTLGSAQAAKRAGRLPLAGSPCWSLFPVENNDKEGFQEGGRCGEPSLVIGQKNSHKAVTSSQCPARNCWVTS